MCYQNFPSLCRVVPLSCFFQISFSAFHFSTQLILSYCFPTYCSPHCCFSVLLYALHLYRTHGTFSFITSLSVLAFLTESLFLLLSAIFPLTHPSLFSRHSIISSLFVIDNILFFFFLNFTNFSYYSFYLPATPSLSL